MSRRLRFLVPILVLALGIFLVFFSPIQSVGFLFAEGIYIFLRDHIIGGGYPTDPKEAVAYSAALSRISLVSGIISITILAALLLALSWWLYSVGTKLAYSLGYRATKITVGGFTASLASDANEVLPPQELSPSGEEYSSTETPHRPVYLADTPLLGIQNARLRLEAHVTSLRNASILNLFTGIAIAAAGIMVLYTVFIDIEKFGVLSERKISATDFLIFTLLPRLSATFFIQIFAYFFLLMYRSNLADIRYFQNEMSNLVV